jgi:hypothetical protein
MPARVLLQDFTGVPAVADLAAMRDAMAKLGGDATKINPLLPAELVIDHSVQVDKFNSGMAFAFNAELEFQRNVERYGFLRWGQRAFSNFQVVPPDTGICHQVNLEYLARVVFDLEENGRTLAYPDSLVGTDSHTTMVNGLGVFGWGVGGIEAEAAMLGQPLSMLIPEVVGFKLHGRLAPGSTATDLVLIVTEMLRKLGVVNKFVEFYGTGLSSLSLPDRHHRQHGARIRRDHGIFPRGRRNARVSALHRPRCATHSAGRRLRQAPGNFPHRRHARSRVFANHRARSRDSRSRAGGAEAPAGSRPVAQCKIRIRNVHGRRGAEARRRAKQRRSLRAF